MKGGHDHMGSVMVLMIHGTNLLVEEVVNVHHI